MISSKINQNERKSMLADVYGETIFIIIPFFCLVIINIVKYIDEPSSIKDAILLATDWSLISAVIYGQCICKIAKVIPLCNSKIDGSKLIFYIAKRLFLFTLSLVFYGVIVFKPMLTIGFLQIILFIVSIFLFIKDSLASKILEKKHSKL